MSHLLPHIVVFKSGEICTVDELDSMKLMAVNKEFMMVTGNITFYQLWEFTECKQTALEVCNHLFKV